MKVIGFITDFQAVKRLIDHMKLAFVAERPPPSHVFTEVALPDGGRGSGEVFMMTNEIRGISRSAGTMGYMTCGAAIFTWSELVDGLDINYDQEYHFNRQGCYKFGAYRKRRLYKAIVYFYSLFFRQIHAKGAIIYKSP